jgi:Methylase involved in ubiquinone/menaquinone biosynthesis
MPAENILLILYTTQYRLGGKQFPVVAKTLADEKREDGFDGEIIIRAVESKRDVLEVIGEISCSGRQMEEFHFVGHSGMYGPMYGTVAFPEQFSPYEWETMEIPFAQNASAYFHCCRSARWFAPFFARTFKVKAYGFFWYTTFSLAKDRYKYAGDKADGKLYTIGCPGRKSHGLWASAKKFAGVMPAEKMRSFEPDDVNGADTYNKVAGLYDEVFTDIRVRRDEWEWLNTHLPPTKNIRVLDIGCGNGALLNALADRVESGIGVDESESILDFARKRNAARDNIQFEKITGPVLPFEDSTFDVVISLMSFRYLDWDPLLAEIRRVAKAGGKLLIIDMVTVPVKYSEYPRLLIDKLKTMKEQKQNRGFDQNLRKLVSHPDWKKMLEFNPIRSEHEMKWYLESRFPERSIEVLNRAWNSRILAFESGPIGDLIEAKLSYP